MDELERAVATTWSPDTLAVYADALLAAGDIRGDIIAHELADLDTATLLVKWLGTEYRAWRGARVRLGFVEATGAALDQVLASRAAPYLRTVHLEGTTSELWHWLRILAATPNRFLSSLTVIARRRMERRSMTAPYVIAPELAGHLVTALPNLGSLRVVGTRVLPDFAHPAVRRVSVIGHDAIGALAHAGAALSSVESLFYAFSADPNGQVAFTEHGLPPTLLAAHTLPSVRDLDLSANELQRSWDNGRVHVFELLAELGVLPQLRALRTPRIETDEERALVEHARTLAPQLADVRDGAAGLFPIHDALEPATRFELQLAGHATVHQVSVRRLGELVALVWDDLGDELRDMFRTIWQWFAELPELPWDVWGAEPAWEAVPAVTLREALLYVPTDDDPAWAAVADELAPGRTRDVLLRRYRGF